MKNYCAEHGVYLDKKNFLNKGAFSKAYKINEKVVIRSSDIAKECLAMFCQDERNKHIPKTSCLDDINNFSVYEMPFYNPLKASSKLAWSHYKELKKTLDEMPYDECIQYACFNNYIKRFKACNVPEELKQALIILISEMMNYSDNIFVEFSPRNLKVDNEGNLILLDIIGDSKSLDNIRKRKRNNY